MCALAAPATAPKVLAVPKMPASLASPWPISCSKSRTLRAVQESLPARKEAATRLWRQQAKAMTDAEIYEAAEYFSSLKAKQIIKVVESDTVPKTYIARLFFAKREDGGTEPLGSRVVEFPNDVEQFELRDSRSQFTAYVPVGSVAKGEALTKTGGSGATIPCAICHGSDLRGIGPIPGIAGRSPSYIVRQLYDFQQGTRAGSSAALMKSAVAKLSQEDMIALAAYISSLDP
jgi:cytochrome c553